MTPGLSPWSPTGEIVRYVLEGPGYTLNELKAVQDWVLQRALKTVPGVIDVTGFGGTVKQYQVLVDPMQLNSLRHHAPAGSGRDFRSRMPTSAATSSPWAASRTSSAGSGSWARASIRSTRKTSPSGPSSSIKSSTISAMSSSPSTRAIRSWSATSPRWSKGISLGWESSAGRMARKQENDVVEGIVLMRKYEKSLPVIRRWSRKRSRRSQEQKLLPAGMRIKIFNERTELVHVTTHNVLHNLLVGMGLVIAILFIFLGDLASAGIVAIMIPLALLFSITVLYVQGKSANLLSIGAVDFGIIVDSSTIIVENIYRHVTAPGADRSRPLIDRIIEASSEIERALFFSTTIIVCAFIPLFSMSGPEGALFGPMANTYAFAICGALLDGGDAGPGPLLVLLREQARGARHDARQDHEAPLPAGLELGLAASSDRRSR